MIRNGWGCGSSMDGVPDCSLAVPGFDPSLGQIWHPQPWRPSLGKRTRGALNLRQMWKHCADLGRGGGRLSRRRRDNCSESRWKHQVNSSEIISVNVGECGRMYEEMMTLMSMEGRSWQSPTPKQQLPRTETMGKPSTHNIVSRMTEEG